MFGIPTHSTVKTLFPQKQTNNKWYFVFVQRFFFFLLSACKEQTLPGGKVKVSKLHHPSGLQREAPQQLCASATATTFLVGAAAVILCLTTGIFFFEIYF